MTLNDGKERFVWLDALRVSACFGVVVLHVVAPLISLLPLNSAGWWMSNIIMSIISPCILVFVMISGALFLGRPCHADIPGFFARRFRFVAQVFFWTVFYLILRGISECDLTWGQLWRDICRGVPYYHLWFLYMILGLYLVTPLLCRYVRKVSRSVRISVVLFLLLSVCVLTLAGESFSCLPHQNIMLLFIPFVPFFLLGHELFSVDIGDRPGKACIGIFIVTATTLSVVAYICLSLDGCKVIVPWLFGSFSPFVLVMAVSIFQFFHAMGGVKCAVLIARISPFTLGIYVLHPLFVRLLVWSGFPGTFMSTGLAVVMLILIVFIWSAVTVWAVGKIPYIRRLVIAGI